MTPPSRHRPAPTAFDANRADDLLVAIDALESELAMLRAQADVRRGHLDLVRREVALAARLQADFLPRRLPEVGVVRFHAFHKAAGGVSGDMYGVDRIDEHHVGLHLIDAVGHGMPAALLAMFLHQHINAKIVHDGGYTLLGPDVVMGNLNAALCGRDLTNGFFATALFARFDTRNGDVGLARGGHPLPLLVHGEEVTAVGGEGALLGVIPDEAFGVTRLTLGRGDRLVFCTDGAEALAARRGAGDPDVWREAIASRAHLSAADLAADLQRLVPPAPADDVTVLIAEHI